MKFPKLENNLCCLFLFPLYLYFEIIQKMKKKKTATATQNLVQKSYLFRELLVLLTFFRLRFRHFLLLLDMHWFN